MFNLFSILFFKNPYKTLKKLNLKIKIKIFSCKFQKMSKLKIEHLLLAFICVIGIHKSFICDATPLDDYVNAPDTNVN